jgi:hypothetical protein
MGFTATIAKDAKELNTRILSIPFAPFAARPTCVPSRWLKRLNKFSG